MHLLLILAVLDALFICYTHFLLPLPVLPFYLPTTITMQYLIPLRLFTVLKKTVTVLHHSGTV